MQDLVLNVGNYQLSLTTNEHNGEHFIALKPLCETLGLEWKRQQKRTLNNPQFSVGVHKGVNWSADGKQYDMLCIPVCEVGMWLCTINANKINDEARPKLLAFQKHLQVVIHEHLTGCLTLERLQQLEATVAHLAQLVTLIQQENMSLKRQLAGAQAYDRVVASCAGKQLAASKKLTH